MTWCINKLDSASDFTLYMLRHAVHYLNIHGCSKGRSKSLQVECYKQALCLLKARVVNCGLER